MKLDGALKGGLAGVTTLGLLTETLGKANGNSSHFNLLQKGKLKKRLKKSGNKKGLKATKQYLAIAEDLLASATYLGIGSLHKRKNHLVKGGILGAAAGLGNVFLNGKDNYSSSTNGSAMAAKAEDENLASKVLKVSLYAIGGMIAGRLAQNLSKKKKRKK